MKNYKLGRNVSFLTVLLNVVLSIIKFIAGIIGKSSAMIADAIHTLSDVVTTIIVIFGLTISSKEADEDHPYGHEKFESALAKLVSVILFLTGLYIGYEAIRNLISGNYNQPGTIALGAAALSIIVKEIMYQYTIKTARKIKSIGMEADAWHHRTDVFTSIATFIGILGARFGLHFLDPLAALMVSGLIIKIGIELYVKSVNELVDKAADQSIIDEVTLIVLATDGVEKINNLKTRVSGNNVSIDLKIAVNKELSVKEGHLIAENVQDDIEENISEVKHCMVHVEPY